MRRKWIIALIVLLAAGGVGSYKWYDQKRRRDICDNDFLIYDLQDRGGLALEEAWEICLDQYKKCLRSEDPHEFTVCLARANGNPADVRACY